MKKFLLASAVTFPLVLSAALTSIHDGELQSTITNQSVTNDVIASTSTIETSENKNEDGTSKIVHGSASTQVLVSDKITLVNIPLSYNVTDNIGLSVNVPYVSNKQSGENGIGDVSFGANYNLGSAYDDIGLHIFGYRYKSTTGGDIFDGLGSGASANSFSYSNSKQIVNSINLFSAFNYTMNGEAESSGVTFEYGDSYTVMVGESHPCMLTDMLTTTTKISYFHNGASTVAGWENNDELTTADFWIDFSSDNIVENVLFAFGVKIPLMYDVGSDTTNSGDAGKNMLYYFNVSSLF